MTFEAVTLTVVAVLAVQLAACMESRTPAQDKSIRQPDITLSSGQRLTRVSLRQDQEDSSLALFYRTNTSLLSCKQMQAEVREVWSQLLRNEAIKRGGRVAVVFPEDPSLSSQGFRYVLNANNVWEEANFIKCRD